MKNPVLYTIYKYDTDLFITMFCENKSRPQLKCNGKCYLAKMQKEQNENDASNRLKQLQTETVYFTLTTQLSVTGNEIYLKEESKQTSYKNKIYSFLFASYLVKPPEVATHS